MNLQELVDSMVVIGQSERAKYHLTLGEAIRQLEATNSDYRVTFDYDENLAPNRPHSYRGFYEDLALEPESIERIIVADLLTVLDTALNATFNGYKGGDYVMTEETPLWAAEWGDPGRAITGMHVEGRGVVLETKDIDH